MDIGFDFHDEKLSFLMIPIFEVLECGLTS